MMNRSLYLALPLLALLALLQAAVLTRFPIWDTVPQLAVVATLSWALLRGPYEGLIWAFVAGVLLDLFSFSPMGASALSLMAAVLSATRLQRILPENRYVTPPLLVALGTLAGFVVYLLLLRITGYGANWAAFNQLPAMMLLHALAALPLYWIMDSLNRLLYPPPVEV